MINKLRPIILITIFSSLSAYLIYRLYIPYAGVGWDEAKFIYEIYQIHNAIINRNLSLFWQTTLNQYYNPPLQSWLMGLMLVPFSASIENIRIAGLLWHVLNPVLIYLLATTISSAPQGKLIGLIAATLYLLSPMAWLHGALALKESVGTSFSLFTILIYLKVFLKPRRRRFILVGFLILLTIMIKYHYGFWLLIGVGINCVIDALNKKTKVNLCRYLPWILIPVFVGGAYWISIQSYKIIDYLSKQIEMTQNLGNFWDHLLFYPQSLLFVYAFFPIIGICNILSLLLISRYWRDRQLRLLWLIATTNIIFVGSWWNNLHDRYIFSVIPLIYLLTAHVIVDVCRRINLTIFLKTLIKISGVLIIILTVIINYPRFIKNIYAVGAYSLKTPLFSQNDYQDLWFVYDQSFWPQQIPNHNQERPSSILEYIAKHIDLSKPWYIVGYFDELSPKYAELILGQFKRQNNYMRLPYREFVITIEVLPNSIHYNHDFLLSNAANSKYVQEIQKNAEYFLLTNKLFQQLAILVSVYVKP